MTNVKHPDPEMEKLIEGMCKWLKEVKGITEIDLFQMVTMLPEYEQYLKDNNLQTP